MMEILWLLTWLRALQVSLDPRWPERCWRRAVRWWDSTISPPASVQPIHAGDEDVLHAPILQLRQHLQPELRSFRLRYPQPQHFLLAFQVDSQHYVNRLVLDVALVSHFHHQRVQIHDGIQLFQRPTLPGFDFLAQVGDQRRRNLDAVHLLQMALDLARRHPPRVHRDDLVVKAGPARLALGHDLGIERSLAVARSFQLQLAKLTLPGLLA